MKSRFDCGCIPFQTPDIAGLLEKFMAVRKAVTGPNHPRNLIPFSEVTRLMTGRIDSRLTKALPANTTARRIPTSFALAGSVA